jgi:hypothetical protein
MAAGYGALSRNPTHPAGLTQPSTNKEGRPKGCPSCFNDGDLYPGGLPIETASIDSYEKFDLNIVQLCYTHN